ncbi:hypothetical protein TA3x_001982 [Tundrisphaera sp. TA3]|uniref:hypothetical protein n=1 Tax=Tundrisphaera sp. TA3 TaxID=3435775 RepID=UPI003EB8D157
MMNYWLNLFTGKTWREFQEAGATTSGFRENNWGRTKGIRQGDILLCYLVGVKRWVGLLEVASERRRDESPIFAEEVFPVRFTVKPLAVLKPEYGVLMDSLAGRLTFFPPNGTSRQWSGMVRGSPTRYKTEDGEAIVAAIRDAVENPVSRPVDSKKLERPANLYKLKAKAGDEEIETIVSIPSKEDEQPPQAAAKEPEDEGPSHTEIQWKLLNLGSQMGLNVWAPRADRGRMWGTKKVGDIPNMLANLPTQFDEGTTRTIENIDVLWMAGQAIAAAFEVEHSTTVYSGLLRMSDLLTMQPNLDINLYLVGPDERYAKFAREVARPTFASRRKPLHTLCGFLPYSKLCERIEETKNVIRFLKPEFIDEIAEFYDPADDID